MDNVFHLVKFDELPLEQLAAILHVSEYEAMKFREHPIPVFRYPNKEDKKRDTIFKIVEGLEKPCTQAVLRRRTRLSQAVLSRFLKELVDNKNNNIKKEFDNRCEMDIYSLSRSTIETDAPFNTLEEKQNTIWNMWVTLLDEYKINSYTDNNLNGKSVKLLFIGKTIKTNNMVKSNIVNKDSRDFHQTEKLVQLRKKAEERAVKKYKKTYVAMPWKVLE